MDYPNGMVYYRGGARSTVSTYHASSGTNGVVYSPTPTRRMQPSEVMCPDRRLHPKCYEVIPTLQKICIQFVSYHIQLLDSLCGFPQIVGKQIFNECARAGYFTPHKCTDLNPLNLFMEAYHGEVLPSLNLCGEAMFLAASLDTILPYTHIQHIDISNCRIGNSHEILPHLGMLRYIKTIGLSNNCLSLKGIEALTCKWRRAKCGLDELQMIKLDGNPDISMDCLPHLTSLPSLRLICCDEFHLIDSKLKLRRCVHSMRFHPEILHRVASMGWAASSIQSSINEFNKKLYSGKCNDLKDASTQLKNNTRNENSLKTPLKSSKNRMVICDCWKDGNKKLTSKRSWENSTNDLQVIQTKMLKLDPSVLNLYL